MALALPPGMNYRQQAAGLNRSCSVPAFLLGCFTVFSLKGISNYGEVWLFLLFLSCWTQGSWAQGIIIFPSSSGSLELDFLVLQYWEIQIMKNAPTVLSIPCSS